MAMMKRGAVAATLARVLGASVLALAAVLGATSCMMARPALRNTGAPPVALGAVAVEFASHSGSLIHAWLMRGQPGKGAVLLLHGVGENRTAMLGRATFLHDQGFTVLAPDFQAHGESLGDHITFGALESKDAEAAMDFLHTRDPGERVGVIGVSMGGAAALLGTAANQTDAVVLESVYPTFRDAVADRLGIWLGPLGFLGSPLAPALIGMVGPSIGVTEEQLRPIDRIGCSSAPLLLIAGTDDGYTTLAESRALFARAVAPKQFWAVEGAGHEDLHAYAKTEYEQRVGNFLAANLSSAGAAALPPRVTTVDSTCAGTAHTP